MMEKRFVFLLSLLLLTVSLALYTVHYYLFHDAHHILIFLVSDIAFIPIEVLLVTLVLHQLLETRERDYKLEKLRMVIGLFFSTMGTDLLRILAASDPQLSEFRKARAVQGSWTSEDFARLRALASGHAFSIDAARINLPELKRFLHEKEDFLLRLLENPVMLEHESFTCLLQTLFHATEEFSSRDSVESLPPPDLAHLEGDLARIYPLLMLEWLDYMEYLEREYPYLFSLALRKNPFDSGARVSIDR